MKQGEQIHQRRYSYLTSEIDSAYHAAALKCGVSDSAMPDPLYHLHAWGSLCPERDRSSVGHQ